MNLARLNHILIPTTKDERDRFRNSRFSRVFVAPLGRAWFALSDEGRGLLGLSLLASIVGLDVLHGQNHLLWSLSFALIVASLLVRPLFGLAGVRLEVEGPDRVEAGGVARFRVTLRNEGARDHQSLRVRLVGGDVVLCGDACYLRRSLEDLHLPPFAADADAMRASPSRCPPVRVSARSSSISSLFVSRTWSKPWRRA